MRILLSVFLIFFSVQMVAENTPLEIDEETWKERVEGIDYTEEREVKEDEKPPETGQSDLPSDSLINPEAAQAVSYVLVAIIVLVVLVVILQRYRPSSAVAVTERIEAQSIEEAEENLPMVTLNKIFDDALEKGDYRSALRINFLMILQRMIDARLIVWKKRKTNEQYLKEIKDQNVILPFGMIVKIFDDVWYGEAHITSVQFEGIRRNFETLNANIHGDEK